MIVVTLLVWVKWVCLCRGQELSNDCRHVVGLLPLQLCVRLRSTGALTLLGYIVPICILWGVSLRVRVCARPEILFPSV